MGRGVGELAPTEVALSTGDNFKPKPPFNQTFHEGPVVSRSNSDLILTFSFGEGEIDVEGVGEIDFI